MYAKVLGETPVGLNGAGVVVEVDLERGLPGFEIVGLPDMAVRESRERVRTALKNSGFPFPQNRIRKKSGIRFSSENFPLREQSEK